MLHEILALWDVNAVRARPDLLIAGSPERCVNRLALEDDAGAYHILERLRPAQVPHREAGAQTLAALHAAQPDLPVTPPSPSLEGAYVAFAHGDPYMVTPYVRGAAPPQPEYVDEAWRGRTLGRFLLTLREASTGLDIAPLAPLDMPRYACTLLETISRAEPTVATRLVALEPHFAGVLQAWPSLPTALAHGDLHPVNVLWRNEEAAIAGVIDWEFVGPRPLLYDLAICLGCVGVESPGALVRGFAASLVATVREAGWSLEGLAGLTLLLRLGWLSEWLRRDDREMIALELDYMDVLARNLGPLQEAWETREFPV